MDNVRNWLRGNQLQQYASAFEDDGWEALNDLLHIDDEDLNRCIDKPGHRKRFHRAVQNTNTLSSLPIVKADEINNPQEDEDSNDHQPNTVDNWLQNQGLGQYVENLKKDGWDMLVDLKDMNENDIRKCIDKPGHRKKFQIVLKRLDVLGTTCNKPAVPEKLKQNNEVEKWLQQNDLGQYTDALKSEGWDTVEVLIELSENADDLKRCIEKPGHRKRFQLAIAREKSSTLEKSKLSTEMVNLQDFSKITFTSMETVAIQDSTTAHQSMTPSNTKQGAADSPSREEFSGLQSASTKQNLSQAKQDEMSDNRLSSGGNDDESPTVQFGLSFEGIEPNSHICYYRSTSCTDEETGDDTMSNSTEAGDEYKYVSAETRRNETQDLHRSFSMQTTPPSAMYITKPKNVSICGNIVDIGRRANGKASQKYRDNFRKQMSSTLEGSKEKDALVVETRAYQELEKKVKDSHWGVVIGIPGDGKTSLAIHLSLKYNQVGYEHLELHFARDWKDWVDGSSGSNTGKKQFILIDDIFGRMSIDERRVSEWSSIIDLMQKVVKQRNGRLKVVCTSRKYVFEDVKTKLAQFSSFQESSVIDMTQPQFALTKDEKQDMWKKYDQKYDLGIEMPQFLNEEKKSPHGFPHCVDLFFSSESLQNDVSLEEFFVNPMQSVCKELNNFKDNDKIKYCALLLVLFNNNNLADVLIEEITSKESDYKAVVSGAGLSHLPTSVDVNKSLKGLTGTYITELEGCFSISHDSIRENLAFVFISQNPVYAIQNIDFDYLTDHTICPGQQATDKPYSRLMYILPPQYNISLVERMLSEIKKGNVVTVCAHQAWDDKGFVEKFMQCLLKETNEEQYCTRITDVLNTKDSSTSQIFDFSLLDALRFFGHMEAVTQIVHNKELGKLLDQLQGQIEAPVVLECETSLSLILYNIMGDIGASEALRKFQINSALSMELLDTVCAYIAGETFRCYIFGSHSEGTRIITHIPKRDCDVNYLFCLRNSEVVQSAAEIKADPDIQYFLAVTDEITRPGYVKLQFITNGIPQTKEQRVKIPVADSAVDHQDRVILCKKRPNKIHVDEIKGLNTTTKIVTGKTYEIHHSYRCRSWPKLATKWISRNRHYNWPSRSVIEQIKSLGVFLVPVGSQDSAEKHWEWKILFLLQERLLMSILNATQYRCYIILKMINNDIISTSFDDPVLVSYHLKTCLFYVVENTPRNLWTPERLLDCVQICLKRILQCATTGYFPNYFIPQENLFYGRVGGEVQTKLKIVLSDLLLTKAKFWYFPVIKCGNLGPRLKQTIFRKSGNVSTDQDLVPSTVRLYLKLSKFMSLVKMRILYKCYNPDIMECIHLHFNKAVGPLRKADEIIDHSKKQTKLAFSLVLPYVELSLMSVLMVKAIEETNNQAYILDLLLSKKWTEIGLSIPPRLKQATFLYMCGYINESQTVLRILEQSMHSDMISVCGCQYYHTEVDEETKERVEHMTDSEFRKTMCVSCVAFLPTEKELIPSVLGYEMSRAKLSTLEKPFWYDWAIVDGKVLLQLLLYLNYKRVCEENEQTVSAEVLEDARRKRTSAIEKLQRIINGDQNLGHRETGLNILGWIFRQEGDEVEAKRCFLESLDLPPEYNAAKLHMEDPVYMKL